MISITKTVSRKLLLHLPGWPTPLLVGNIHGPKVIASLVSTTTAVRWEAIGGGLWWAPRYWAKWKNYRNLWNLLTWKVKFLFWGFFFFVFWGKVIFQDLFFFHLFPAREIEHVPLNIPLLYTKFPKIFTTWVARWNDFFSVCMGIWGGFWFSEWKAVGEVGYQLVRTEGRLLELEVSIKSLQNRERFGATPRFPSTS